MNSLVRLMRSNAVCFWFFVALLCGIPTFSSAQIYSTVASLSVLPQPLSVFFDGEALHVLCNSVDNNFNGVQDVGDTQAAWVRFEAPNGVADGNRRQTLVFPWGQAFGFPARPAIDTTGKTLYVAQSGRIRSFDLRSQALKRDTLLLIDSLARTTFGTSGSVSALSIDNSTGRLFLSLRGRSTSAVVEIDLATSRVIARYPAGIFVQQTIPYMTSSGRRGLAILNEGAFGSSTSTLMLARSPQEITTILIGNTGNHLLRVGDEIVVTMNGSHELQIVNLNEERIVRRIPTNTRGFDGPRESAYLRFANQIAVTTYQGTVQFFSYASGATRGSVNTTSKTEGIAVSNSGFTIYVANAFIGGGFTSAASVTEIRSVVNTIRNGSVAPANVRVAPHPVQTSARISVQIPGTSVPEKVSITLHNMLGTKVVNMPYEMSFGSSGGTMLEIPLDADALQLAQGVYLLSIRSESGVQTVPLHIIR